MSHEENNYKQFPALAAYIDRIGARELSYKTFMVQTYVDLYYNDKCYIKIDTEARTISCSNPTYAPSQAEQELILAELANRVFPKPIGADDVSGLIRTIEKKGGRVEKKDLFELWDRETGKIVMVQRRFQAEGEKKQYHPWTLFDDGVWRQMEPGTALPFWKPRKKISNSIMVHEGAKAARFCEWLCRSNEHEAVELRKVHPWFEELNRYEHWGIIGGALAPHRANYSELRDERPADVVYVADNDDQGRRVLNSFSRHYEGQLKWVKFDNRWPKAWDMADEMPAELFDKSKGELFYSGPELQVLFRPATFATELIPNPEGRGRPITTLRSSFAEEWFHSVRPELFVHRDYPNQLYTTVEFNSEVAPFSHSDDLAKFLRKDAANKFFKVGYVPGLPPGICGTLQRGQFINTYSDSPIKERDGDAKPFEDYMRHLVPEDNDRKQLMRWCATLIERPSTKMAYGVLLVSETQGVGKTTLGLDILRPLIGEANVSIPNESDIVESQFNEWIAHRRLAIINEIYQGNSSKAYNRLKSVITDSTVTVNKKHQPTYEIENWLHVFACSNSNRALKISMEDRRWLVPKITEEAQPHEYWVNLHQWLKSGGLGIIKRWARLYLLDNRPVLPGETAPMTATKDQMIEESFSRGQIVAKWLCEEMRRAARSAGEEYFTTDIQIAQQLKNRVYEGKNSPMMEKPVTIRAIAKKAGLIVGEERSRVFSSAGELGRVIATDGSLARRYQANLKNEGLKPFDFNMIGEKI